MRTVVKYSFCTLLFALCTLMTACRGVNIPDAANAHLEKAGNFAYTLDARNVVLTWTVPAGVTAVRLERNGVLVTDEPMGPEFNTWQVYRETPNVDVLYTLKMVYGDKVTEGVTRTIHIDYDGQAGVAYLLPGADESAMTAQEKEAADWFRREYVDQNKGCFVTPETVKGITADLSSTINPDKYSTIWLNLSRDGELPAVLTDSAVMAGLRTFSRVGGKFYFSGMGVKMITAMGRLSEKYSVSVKDNTIEGTGIWGINAKIGNRYDMAADEMTKAYFEGLQKIDDAYFPMLSEGSRTQKDYVWALGGSRSDYRDFQDMTYTTVLGTVKDDKSYQYAGLVEFSKYGLDYTGTMVANGLASAQWLMTDNTYRANIERLTANILNHIRVVE